MGVKNDPTSSPVFSDSSRATKKLQVSASSTKSQQFRAFKFFLFYTVWQIVFRFSFLPAVNVQIRTLAAAAALLFH